MGTKNKAICVLGSGRCGSSMITRALNFMGVYLGEDGDFKHELPINPKGFWELEKIIEIDSKIVNQLHDQYGQLPYPPNWWNNESMLLLKQELKSFIESYFSANKLWGWKDPLTSDCLEMWQSVLRDLNIKVCYVIMVRNPIDVIESFDKANILNRGDALDTWQKRTLLSLKRTYGEDRIIVDYDRFHNNHMKWLRGIVNQFQLEWPENHVILEKQLNDFIDPGLRHNQTGFQELMHCNNISQDAKQLYQLCIKAVDSQKIMHSESFQSEVEKLYQSYILGQRK